MSSNPKSVEIIPPNAGKLADLASEIRALHESFIDNLQVTLDRTMTLGEALIRAKPLVGHGGWLQWLGANTEVSESECQRYMQLARHRAVIESKAAHVRDLTLSAALKLIAKPRDDEPAAAPSPSATTTPSEKRIKALSEAWHDCEPAERAKFQAAKSVLDAATPTKIVPVDQADDLIDQADDLIDRRHRQLDDLHAAWDRADPAVRQTFIRHIVAAGAVVQPEDAP